MSKISGLYLIDTALRTLVYTKFGALLGINVQSSSATDNINKGVLLMSKGTALREIAEKRGENYLDFMNIWRTDEDFDWRRNKTYVGRTGMTLVDQSDPTKSAVVKGVPASLSYSLWCWTRDLDVLNLCIEKYLFWRHQFPKLSILLNNLYPLEFDLHFGSSVDESPIDEKYRIGPYFIRHFTVNVDAWVFDVTSNSDIFRKILVNCYDYQDVETISTLYLPDSPGYDADLADVKRMFQAKLFGIDFVTLVTNSIGIRKDFTADFTVGQKFFIENSTGNDGGPYTVVSSSYASGVTTVFVSETLSDSTVDGNLYIP